MKLNNFRSLTIAEWSHLYATQAIYTNEEGNTIKYDVVSRKEIKTAEDLKGRTDAVTIVAFDQNENMLVTKEFRLACNTEVLESPAGIIDAGETTEEAAIRECFEETGLHVKRVLKVLPGAYSSPGMTNEKVSVVFVEVDSSEKITGSDSANEEISASWIKVKEAYGMMVNSENISARTQLIMASAPYFYELYMNK